MTRPTMVLVRVGGFESLRTMYAISYSEMDALLDAKEGESPVAKLDLPQGDGIWHMIDGKWVEVEP